MLSPFLFAMLNSRLMENTNPYQATGDDMSRQGALRRDNARNDAQMRDASRQGATMRDTTSYTLSVDDVVELMAAGGFPRSKRAIQRFCQMGHLECSRVATELGEKYFITQESVDRRIKELEQLHALSASHATGSDAARHDDVAPLRDTSRQAAQSGDMAPSVAPLRDEARSESNGAEDLDRLRKENEELKDQNLNLKIDNRAKEQVITLLSRERGDFMGQIRHQATRIGEMTARLLQLGAPADEVRRVSDGDNSGPEQRQEGVE
jgi:hypothetical protein